MAKWTQMPNFRQTPIMVKQSTEKKVQGFVIGLLTSVPKSLFRILNTLFVRTFNTNKAKAGKYITKGANIIKFPILVSESIDQNIVSKFCTLLQTEKAENIRTFFFNHDLTLGYANHEVAKEFDPGFYKENMEHFEKYGETLAEAKVARYKPIRNHLDLDTVDQYHNKVLKLPTKDLMPVAPTMINIAVNGFLTTDLNEQIIGIRYIPHRIPFSEIKVAFKYGALNNRFLLRIIKLLQGDLSFGEWLTDKDRKALNFAMTKIAVGKKAWSEALKDSTHAVTMLISKEEYEIINNEILDLTKPINFKHFQKDIGMLDLIIIDKNSQNFYRINSSDNYTEVKYDMREALNSMNKDIVISTKIEASRFNDEGLL